MSNNAESSFVFDARSHAEFAECMTNTRSVRQNCHENLQNTRLVAVLDMQMTP